VRAPGEEIINIILFAAAITNIKTNEQRTSNRGSSTMRFKPEVVVFL